MTPSPNANQSKALRLGIPCDVRVSPISFSKYIDIDPDFFHLCYTFLIPSSSPPGSSAPLPCPGGNDTFCLNGFQYPCPAARVCANGSVAGACPPGRVCPEGSGVPTASEAGTYAVEGVVTLSASGQFAAGGEASASGAPGGTYAPFGSLAPLPCQAGFYCPRANLSAPLLCPKDHYCPAGSVEPRRCRSGSSSPVGIPSADLCVSNGFDWILGGVVVANAVFLLGLYLVAFHWLSLDATSGSGPGPTALTSDSSDASKSVRRQRIAFSLFGLLLTGRFVVYLVSDVSLITYACVVPGTEREGYPGLRLSYLGPASDATSFQKYYATHGRCPSIRCVTTADGVLLCSNTGFADQDASLGLDVSRTDDRASARLISPQSMLGCVVVRGMPILRILNESALVLDSSTGLFSQWLSRGAFVCPDSGAQLNSTNEEPTAPVFRYLDSPLRLEGRGNPFAMRVAFADAGSPDLLAATLARPLPLPPASLALAVYRSSAPLVYINHTAFEFETNASYAIATDGVVAAADTTMPWEPETFVRLRLAALVILTLSLAAELLRLLSFLGLNGRLALGFDYAYPLFVNNVLSVVLLWALPSAFVERIMIGPASEYVLHTVIDFVFIDAPQFALFVAYVYYRQSRGEVIQTVGLVLSTVMLAASTSRWIYYLYSCLESFGKLDGLIISRRSSDSGSLASTSSRSIRLYTKESSSTIGIRETDSELFEWLKSDPVVTTAFNHVREVRRRLCAGSGQQLPESP